MKKPIKDMSVEEIMYETELSEVKADIRKLRECFAIMMGVVSFMALTIFCILLSQIINGGI